MIESAVTEVLFMGTEAETSGLEAFNAVKDEEGLNDDATAVARTTEILIQLIKDEMIEVWLGDPNSREPACRPGDPVSSQMITPERLLTMDEPDGRMLVYETTERGENALRDIWV
ncbi:hypothetical protein [uncultured Actinomyces sp.]|uniref:hypothetical protein n=1 Tax=uncultured Actinomyces sp. TaxID=249061 RepID=UPI00262903CD|nr:hypothetical protein [uncultured Actinomyces sp.]